MKDDIITFIVFVLILIFMWLLFVIMSPPIQEVETISIRNHCVDYNKKELLAILPAGECAGGELKHLEVSIWHCKEV